MQQSDIILNPEEQDLKFPNIIDTKLAPYITETASFVKTSKWFILTLLISNFTSDKCITALHSKNPFNHSRA
jgi:hypothetical protein